MVERFIEMYTQEWEVVTLFSVLVVGFAVSIILHEFGHYLVLLAYKGKPRFGYDLAIVERV